MTRRAVRNTIALAATAALLAGCSSGPKHAGNVGKYRNNPSPALTTLAKRPADNRNSLAIMEDTNWRMFWEDGARVLYIDRPSRLSPKPIPY
ncbi:MAG: hypothetical protein R3B57_05310 [Phycisphaerales bacterium]